MCIEITSEWTETQWDQIRWGDIDRWATSSSNISSWQPMACEDVHADDAVIGNGWCTCAYMLLETRRMHELDDMVDGDNGSALHRITSARMSHMHCRISDWLGQWQWWWHWQRITTTLILAMTLIMAITMPLCHINTELDIQLWHHDREDEEVIRFRLCDGHSHQNRMVLHVHVHVHVHLHLHSILPSHPYDVLKFESTGGVISITSHSIRWCWSRMTLARPYTYTGSSSRSCLIQRGSICSNAFSCGIHFILKKRTGLQCCTMGWGWCSRSSVANGTSPRNTSCCTSTGNACKWMRMAANSTGIRGEGEEDGEEAEDGGVEEEEEEEEDVTIDTAVEFVCCSLSLVVFVVPFVVCCCFSLIVRWNCSLTCVLESRLQLCSTSSLIHRSSVCALESSCRSTTANCTRWSIQYALSVGVVLSACTCRRR